MNPRLLWCTELPPVLDVTRGPINGAARIETQAVGAHCEERIRGLYPDPAAAPPEPTPADLEGAGAVAPACTTTLSQESPGTEREGAAWVPFVVGECPLPPETKFFTMCEGVECGPWIATAGMQWGNPNVTHYRLASPTPRGPCTLPPDHPHAELERLYMSDDTLKVWWWNLACWKEASKPL